MRTSISGVMVWVVASAAGCANKQHLPAPPSSTAPVSEAPLAASSPWPKFRRDLRQDGASAVHPASATGGLYWSYQTGKGIFSNPVIDGDGNIYVGSADRYFYSLKRDGSLRWNLLTDGVIDSAALLDDRGRVYVGSGDGLLRALDPATGAEIWHLQADPPDPTGNTYGVINWFEGNVGIDIDGTLLAPNDVYYLYGVNRDSGAVSWKTLLGSINWSLPAVDDQTGNLFCGNNGLLVDNTFGVSKSGGLLWRSHVTGSIAASPMLTKDGKLYLGGFDGFLRQYDAASGAAGWTFGARDHLYASPALLPDGSIVQASTDGSVYALAPADGSLRWQFDIKDPIRSSPAIDGDGNVYVGAGDGRLYVLGPDGKLRWAIQLIATDRNDLNSSVSLGSDAIYVAGEDGELFSVPYEYCLQAAQQRNPHCVLSTTDELPADGVLLYYTTQFGSTLPQPPTTLTPNAPLAFSLVVRKGGSTQLTLIDATSLVVTVTPPQPVPVSVDVSSDRHFITVIPAAADGNFVADSSGNIAITIDGSYLVDPDRMGLVFSGGTPGGTLHGAYTFALAPAVQAPALVIATGDGVSPTTAWEMYRLSIPLPTILPSYNQIGFDFLHYVLSVVEASPGHVLVWGAGMMLAADANTTVVDPTTTDLFPMSLTYADGLVTLQNDASFAFDVEGTNLVFTDFRISTRLDATGNASESAHLIAKTACSSIQGGYGSFLEMLGFCNSQTDELMAFGASEWRPFAGGTITPPAGIGTISWAGTTTAVTATLTGGTLLSAAHSAAVLLVDAVAGTAVPLDYGQTDAASAVNGYQTRTVAADGTLQAVTLTMPANVAPASVRAYLMVDGYPAGRTALTLQ